MRSVSCLLLLVAVLGMASASAMQSGLDEEATFNLFDAWMREHSKIYDTIEEMGRRYEIFASNLKQIIEHNLSGQSWKLAMNQFGDLTQAEYKTTILSSVPMESSFSAVTRPRVAHLMNVPESVDWVEEGKVNEVQNQGRCGSCWAFSAIASLESADAIENGVLRKFSEQELVDCAGSYSNFGCRGGVMDRAFKFMEAKGVCEAKNYQYCGRQQTCEAGGFAENGCPAAAFVKNYVDVHPRSEKELKAAVAQQPVSIAIEADQFGFQFYHSGVFEGRCGHSLDHGVVIVGYGTDEETGKGYWKIRNSWGKGWGEQGHIRMIRKDEDNTYGQCGLCLMPSYPIATSNPQRYF